MASGTRIGAAGVGVVEFAGWNTGGYGNLVVVRHRLGYATWYAHMSRIAVVRGQSVTGGTMLGYVGSTGHSTGPHLHFELRRNAVPIDPVPYLLAAWRPGRVRDRRRQLAARVAGDARSARRSSATGAPSSTPAGRRTSHAPASRRSRERASSSAVDPRAIARRSSALSSVASSTPFSIATSRIVRPEATASLTISVPRS